MRDFPSPWRPTRPSGSPRRRRRSSTGWPGATTTVSLSTGIGRAVLAVENAPAPKARAASSAQAADAPEGSEGDGENGPVHRGFGLIGMRDRVAELGGSFTAGPTPEGGWRVMAELPVVPE